MRGIKITGFGSSKLIFRLKKPMWWTDELYQGASIRIVEVETNQEMIGLGEIPDVFTACH
jgi:hypothetical protein